MATLLGRLKPYFEPANGGHMIDQAWQPRVVDGMVRAYLVGDRVAGFGHQAINALYPAQGGEPAPAPGPRLYHPADLPQFQELRHRLETQWIEACQKSLAGKIVDRKSLKCAMDAKTVAAFKGCIGDDGSAGKPGADKPGKK